MMTSKRPACVFDLDATLNHAKPVRNGHPIRGRTTDSFLSLDAVNRLSELSKLIDIFVATGRSEQTVSDFRSAFADGGVTINGWILEYGAVVSGRPRWSEKILDGIDLNETVDAISSLITEKGFPIDFQRYQNDHQAMILLSGNGPLTAECFIDFASGIFKNRFRTIVGRRKIAIIPKLADKRYAFEANFGQTHFVRFAVGDHTDDLALLESAAFPLTTLESKAVVRDYVKRRGGFISRLPKHGGTLECIDRILSEVRGGCVDFVPAPPIPREETDIFRPSRRSYLDLIFAETPSYSSQPDPEFLFHTAQKLHDGKDVLIEVEMRDWGGESKPLEALLRVMVPFLPHARWRLVFRPERIGVENLKDFHMIECKIPADLFSTRNGARFCAPGVPGSPEMKGDPSLILWLYDHPDDLKPWYDSSVSRLLRRHPDILRGWILNPMYLKIAGAMYAALRRTRRSLEVETAGPRVMMAANVVDETDIRIAVEGFKRLHRYLDALIIAPRVVTNPVRNDLIRKTAEDAGEKIIPLSETGSGDRPRIVFVDTYGDLSSLYPKCEITYLGGGFDPRKRGFDPMESLAVGVPVIMGPLYDYNRITVEGLRGSGWIEILNSENDPVTAFVDLVASMLSQTPDPESLHQFIKHHKADPIRVAAELSADLIGMTENGYLFNENDISPREHVRARIIGGNPFRLRP